jgi:hypothetical protein
MIELSPIAAIAIGVFFGALLGALNVYILLWALRAKERKPPQPEPPRLTWYTVQPHELVSELDTDTKQLTGGSSQND